jgi:hypothetical protein
MGFRSTRYSAAAVLLVLALLQARNRLAAKYGTAAGHARAQGTGTAGGRNC